MSVTVIELPPDCIMSKPSSNLSPIPPRNFYKNHEFVIKSIEKVEERNQDSRELFRNVERMPRRLLGPSQKWMVFYRQANAIEFAENESSSTNTLLTFVYERLNEQGKRVFIVAHPEVYWWYFNKMPPEKKCAYEVITEGSPCVLYLDLEFSKDLNKNSNGPRMTKTIIDIICAYMKTNWEINCDERNVLNLDSTTNIKFSRHIIFRMKNIAFENNISVGRCVKKICSDIEEYLATDGCAFHNVLSYFKREHLEELMVDIGKRNKIFVDTGVYTRNRHFRIYKATKCGKLSHLQLAPENKYVLLEKQQDKELEIFLESLISYFPDKRELVYLEVNEYMTLDINKYSQKNSKNQIRVSRDQMKQSPYPAIDKFILDLVHPGVIRMLKFSEESQTITYDIIGNRYCANIDRPHKSNNIYWVANLKHKFAYQKCYDQEDCANFRSQPIPFPSEISFQLSEEDDDLFFNIPENLENSTASTNPDNSI